MAILNTGGRDRFAIHGLAKVFHVFGRAKLFSFLEVCLVIFPCLFCPLPLACAEGSFCKIEEGTSLFVESMIDDEEGGNAGIFQFINGFQKDDSKFSTGIDAALEPKQTVSGSRPADDSNDRKNKVFHLIDLALSVIRNESFHSFFIGAAIGLSFFLGLELASRQHDRWDLSRHDREMSAENERLKRNMHIIMAVLSKKIELTAQEQELVESHLSGLNGNLKAPA